MTKYKELLLIDGRNYCYRHAYTRAGLYSKGRPSGAIYGALSGLIRLNRYFPDAAIVFCWDGDGSKQSWRHKLAPDYKGTRHQKKESEVPQQVKDIRMQIPVIEKMLRQLGFQNFSVPKLEADDLIGILATSLHEQYHKVIIYSTDKDFYQLIKDNIVVVRDFDKTQGCKEITAKEIKKEHGFWPKQWLHYRSLVGEKTDNIAKPIPGVGPAKAMKMMEAGVDPSNSTPHPDYAAHWDKIRLCYRLTKIVRKYHDKRVPHITQKQIRIILKKSKLASMYRSPEFKTKQNYKKLIHFLADYELQDIMERRQALWQIK